MFDDTGAGLAGADPDDAAEDCVVWVGGAEGGFVADAVLSYYLF